MTATTKISIGSVSIPTDDYVIGGTALLGIRDSGKTYAAKGLAEQLLEQDVPIIVFDPIGRWRYLKTAGSGKNAKAYKIVVAGGAEPDLPLTPQSAPEIVRAAIRENIPLVLDFYDRKLSKTDWRRIVQSCFRTLLYENEGRRHIFLEETAEFAPQRVSDGETYAEVEKLVRMGGNVSLGITLINQRAQEINKAILDLCENLVLMRQRGSHAIDSIEKWMDKLSPDEAKKIATSLPHMSSGDAWVFTGDSEAPVRTRTVAIRTFHPDRRKPELNPRLQEKRTADTHDFVNRLNTVLPKLAEEAKANDPAALKKRIAELERQVKTPSTAPVDTASLERRAFEKGFAAAVVGIFAVRQRVLSAANGFMAELGGIRFEPDLPAQPHVPPRLPPAGPALGKPAAPSSGNGSSDLGTGGKRRILTALAQYPEGMNQRKLSILVDIAPKGGTWRNYMAELRSKGWIEGRKDHLQITAAGVEALGSYEPLPTGQALIDYWRNRLGASGKRAIFDSVAAVYPKTIATEQVAQITGIAREGGTWRNYLAELRGLGLVEGRGELRASEDLFS